jgi:hypothetical protein
MTGTKATLALIHSVLETEEVSTLLREMESEGFGGRRK